MHTLVLSKTYIKLLRKWWDRAVAFGFLQQLRKLKRLTVQKEDFLMKIFNKNASAR